MRKALLVAAMASLVVSAVVGIAIFLMGEFGETQQKLLLTILAVGGFSLVGLACTANVSSWWLWPLRPLGLATSLVALGVAVPLIWELIGQDETILKAFGTLCCVAVTSAHVALLGTFPVRNITEIAYAFVHQTVIRRPDKGLPYPGKLHISYRQRTR